MKLKAVVIIVLAFFTAFDSMAQYTGYTVELDTVFLGPNTPTPDDLLDPDGLLEFYGTYRVYANFTNPTDVLSAIYSDVAALGTPPMYIDAPCGCHNPVSSSVAMDASNPSSLWVGPFIDYEYDTYWTIGMASSDAPGVLPQTVGTPNGSGVCSAIINDGTLFSIGSPENAIAGDDLRILIAQVTTCGDWTFSACFQVFVGGDQTIMDNACPDIYSVTHLYNNGACVNDLDGDGICDEMEIPGCLEEGACNYVANATDDTGNCDYSCFGCTNMTACNFNEVAYIDDGTCIIPGDPCDDGDLNSVNDVIQINSCECAGYGCDDPQACNYNPQAIPDPNICNYIGSFSITGELNPLAIMMVSYSYPNTTGSTYEWTSVNGDVVDGEGTADINVVWWGDGTGTICVTETNSGGCAGDLVCLDVSITPVSIAELENDIFQVFPTPANDVLYFKLSPTMTGLAAKLSIRDVSGQIVKELSLNDEGIIDVSQLSRGSYILQLILQGESPSYKRIILN